MLNSIQYLRGIASLFVVLFHMKWMINNIYSQKNLGDLLFVSGNFGVDLFFVISGFVICLSTEKMESNAVIKFIIRRFFRIYPLLFISVVFVYFLSVGVEVRDFIRSLVPIHLDYSKKSPTFDYNILISAWTITYEIVFYGIFLVAMLFSHKFRCELAILFILVLNIIANFAIFGEYSISLGREANVDSITVIFSSSMLLEFIYGIIIYKFYILFISRIANFKDTYFLWLSLMLVIIGFLIKPRMFDGHGVFRWGLVSFFIIMLFLLIEKSSCLYHSKVLYWLGDISYSLYITHIVVLEFIFKSLMPNIWNSDSGFIKLLFFLMICLIVSHLTYKFIERPFISYGKKLIKTI